MRCPTRRKRFLRQRNFFPGIVSYIPGYHGIYLCPLSPIYAPLRCLLPSTTSSQTQASKSRAFIFHTLHSTSAAAIFEKVLLLMLSKSRQRLLNPIRTAVPFWGQTTLIPSDLSPKRDRGPKRVNCSPVLGTNQSNSTNCSRLCTR